MTDLLSCIDLWFRFSERLIGLFSVICAGLHQLREGRERQARMRGANERAHDRRWREYFEENWIVHELMRGCILYCNPPMILEHRDKACAEEEIINPPSIQGLIGSSLAYPEYEMMIGAITKCLDGHALGAEKDILPAVAHTGFGEEYGSRVTPAASKIILVIGWKFLDQLRAQEDNPLILVSEG